MHVPVLGLYFPNRKFPCRSFDPWAHASKSVHVWLVSKSGTIVVSCRRPPDGQYEQNVKVPDDGGGEWSASLRIHIPQDSVAWRHNELMYTGRGLGT